MTRRTDRGISGRSVRHSWVETRPGLFDSIIVAVCVGIAAGAAGALVTGVDGVAVAPTVVAVLGVRDAATEPGGGSTDGGSGA